MSLEILPRPYEFLEINDGESQDLNIVNYKEGSVVIVPRLPNPQIPKQITVLRVYYDRDPSLPGIEYYDVSSQTLIYQLAPMLDDIIKEKKIVRISAYGKGVKKRFTVSVL